MLKIIFFSLAPESFMCKNKLICVRTLSALAALILADKLVKLPVPWAPESVVPPRASHPRPLRGNVFPSLDPHDLKIASCACHGLLGVGRLRECLHKWSLAP